MKLFGCHSNKRAFFLTIVVLVTISALGSFADDEAGGGEDEDLKPKKIKKDKAGKRKKPVVSSQRSDKAVQTQLKTETMIAASEMKPEDRHISSTLAKSAGGKLTLESADDLTTREFHNWCGCGGDQCEKKTICAHKEFQPLCCMNKCKCVKLEKFELNDYWKQLKRETACKILGCMNSEKPTCYDASAAEFNCWTQYNSVDHDDNDEDVKEDAKEKLETALKGTKHVEGDTTQYAYFGCDPNYLQAMNNTETESQ